MTKQVIQITVYLFIGAWSVALGQVKPGSVGLRLGNGADCRE